MSANDDYCDILLKENVLNRCVLKYLPASALCRGFTYDFSELSVTFCIDKNQSL